jgi:hypothetical protein
MIELMPRAFPNASNSSMKMILGALSFAKNLSRQQVVDLSALIQRESRLDDHPRVLSASTAPVPDSASQPVAEGSGFMLHLIPHV